MCGRNGSAASTGGVRWRWLEDSICTGWRYVVEELQRAGITAHLAEPAETAGLRGSKRRAKTD